MDTIFSHFLVCLAFAIIYTFINYRVDRYMIRASKKVRRRKRDFEYVKAVILSCQTHVQLVKAGRLIRNFRMMYGESEMTNHLHGLKRHLSTHAKLEFSELWGTTLPNIKRLANKKRIN